MAKVREAIGGGFADSRILQVHGERMVKRDFAPQGYVRQLLKDLEMVHRFAEDLRSPTPMLGEARSLYRELVRLGHSELDAAAVLKVYEVIWR